MSMIRKHVQNMRNINRAAIYVYRHCVESKRNPVVNLIERISALLTLRYSQLE